jgi:aspartate/methionine/tyrosine aminotransferase
MFASNILAPVHVNCGNYVPFHCEESVLFNSCETYSYRYAATRQSEAHKMIIQNEKQGPWPAVSVPIRQHPLPAEFPGAHAIDEEEEEALLRVCRSKSLYRYHGIDPQREASQFEQEFAAFTGARHAVAVTSGTAALHTAFGALGVGPGQEVIIPAYLWVSIAAAVVNLGAIPVLADIDETLNVDDFDCAYEQHAGECTGPRRNGSRPWDLPGRGLRPVCWRNDSRPKRRHFRGYRDFQLSDK